MPTRRKQPPATKPSEKTNAVKSPAPPATSGAKVPANGDQMKMTAVGALLGAIILAALWSTGVFSNIFAGPKVPLPRQVNDLALGMTLDEVIAKYPMLNMDRTLDEYKVKSLEELFKKKPSLKKNIAQLQRALRSF